MAPLNEEADAPAYVRQTLTKNYSDAELTLRTEVVRVAVDGVCPAATGALNLLFRALVHLARSTSAEGVRCQLNSKQIGDRGSRSPQP